MANDAGHDRRTPAEYPSADSTRRTHSPRLIALPVFLRTRPFPRPFDFEGPDYTQGGSSSESIRLEHVRPKWTRFDWRRLRVAARTCSTLMILDPFCPDQMNPSDPERVYVMVSTKVSRVAPTICRARQVAAWLWTSATWAMGRGFERWCRCADPCRRYAPAARVSLRQKLPSARYCKAASPPCRVAG